MERLTGRGLILSSTDGAGRYYSGVGFIISPKVAACVGPNLLLEPARPRRRPRRDMNDSWCTVLHFL
eukprot:8644919-Pyramimonas_sp.AAC.1